MSDRAGGPWWPTPEEAAVGSFSPAAEATVVAVRWEKLDEAAEVHITVGPAYDYYVHVIRTPEGWVETHSGN